MNEQIDLKKVAQAFCEYITLVEQLANKRMTLNYEQDFNKRRLLYKDIKIIKSRLRDIEICVEKKLKPLV